MSYMSIYYFDKKRGAGRNLFRGGGGAVMTTDKIFFWGGKLGPGAPGHLGLLLLFIVYLTLTDPLRIQPWSQDRRNQTKSNRKSEINRESRHNRTDKKVASKGHRRDKRKPKIENTVTQTVERYVNQTFYLPGETMHVTRVGSTDLRKIDYFDPRQCLVWFPSSPGNGQHIIEIVFTLF